MQTNLKMMDLQCSTLDFLKVLSNNSWVHCSGSGPCDFVIWEIHVRSNFAHARPCDFVAREIRSTCGKSSSTLKCCLLRNQIVIIIAFFNGNLYMVAWWLLNIENCRCTCICTCILKIRQQYLKYFKNHNKLQDPGWQHTLQPTHAEWDLLHSNCQ